MNTRRLTEKLVVTTVGGWILYDIWVIVEKSRTDDSISRVIADFAASDPAALIVTMFGIGLLCGHWFWGMGPAEGGGRR